MVFLSKESPGLEQAIVGNDCQEIGPDFAYGHAKYLTPSQVREITLKLQAVSPTSLADRFLSGEFAEDKVHGNFGADPSDTEELEHLTTLFEGLKLFYRSLVEKEVGVVLVIQ